MLSVARASRSQVRIGGSTVLVVVYRFGSEAGERVRSERHDGAALVVEERRDLGMRDDGHRGRQPLQRLRRDELACMHAHTTQSADAVGVGGPVCLSLSVCVCVCVCVCVPHAVHVP